MLRKIITATLIGVDARTISVEADVQPGLPYVNIVGLADTTIKEARERVKAAIINSGFEYPKQRITINLSPAGIPKEGSHFDLPIAVGIIGTYFRGIDTENFGFIGELSLDGSLNGVRGALPLVMEMRQEGVRKIILPADNAREVSLLRDVELYPVKSLEECVKFLAGNKKIDRYIRKEKDSSVPENIPDFSEVKGNEIAKRGLVIAAAGNHGILMVGPPGCGKTMMARRLPFILPEMDYSERLEVAKIHSAAGSMDDDYIIAGKRPFRSPHHTITKAAMIGGGRIPHPGEISLAHNGVLFLDEFGEFDPATLELLRQPVEEGAIHINRERMEVDFPCRIMLVAAANPCKCGYRGDDEHICTCSLRQLESYYAKFSGPMLDRIDLHMMINPISEDVLKNKETGMTSSQMKEMVAGTVERQKSRYRGTGICFNSRLEDRELERYCRLDSEAKKFIEEAFRNYSLSMRAYKKLLKVSRTVADLEGSDDINWMHIAEALQYRTLEQFYRR